MIWYNISLGIILVYSLCVSQIILDLMNQNFSSLAKSLLISLHISVQLTGHKRRNRFFFRLGGHIFNDSLIKTCSLSIIRWPMIQAIETVAEDGALTAGMHSLLQGATDVLEDGNSRVSHLIADDQNSTNLRLNVWRGMATTIAYASSMFNDQMGPVWLYIRSEVDGSAFSLLFGEPGCTWGTGIPTKIANYLRDMADEGCNAIVHILDTLGVLREAYKKMAWADILAESEFSR